MRVRCRCGSDNPDGAAYCNKCGVSLDPWAGEKPLADTYVKYGSRGRLLVSAETRYSTKNQYIARLTVAVVTTLVITGFSVATGYAWFGLAFLLFMVGALFLSWYTGRRAAGWK